MVFLKFCTLRKPKLSYRDSLIFDANVTGFDPATGLLEVSSGFSLDMWRYMGTYSGLEVQSVVGARTWGSKEVQSCCCSCCSCTLMLVLVVKGNLNFIDSQ